MSKKILGVVILFACIGAVLWFAFEVTRAKKAFYASGSVHFSADGKEVVTILPDPQMGSVRIYSWNTDGKPLKHLTADEFFLSQKKPWDAYLDPSNFQHPLAEGENNYDAAFSSAASLLAVGNHDGVALWKLPEGTLERNLLFKDFDNEPFFRKLMKALFEDNDPGLEELRQTPLEQPDFSPIPRGRLKPLEEKEHKL